MSYSERSTVVPGVVLWRKGIGPHEPQTRVLPDGCLDLIWDGRRVFVAGPDTTARLHTNPPGAHYTALRASRGIGAALIGVPAHELCDRSPGIHEIWPERHARELTDRIAAAPAASLDQWLARRLPDVEIDPLGGATFAAAADGVPVSRMADRFGLSARQLHRRCLPLFGYGPRHLARVLRLGRALDRARDGMALADVAAASGFTDQSHLTREVRELAGTTPARLVRELSG